MKYFLKSGNQYITNVFSNNLFSMSEKSQQHYRFDTALKAYLIICDNTDVSIVDQDDQQFSPIILSKIKQSGLNHIASIKILTYDINFDTLIDKKDVSVKSMYKIGRNLIYIDRSNTLLSRYEDAIFCKMIHPQITLTDISKQTEMLSDYREEFKREVGIRLDH